MSHIYIYISFTSNRLPSIHKINVINLNKKGKVFYGQESPSGESTAIEFGVDYQLLAVIY